MVSTLGVFNLHPLEVVSRYRDPQLQVGENYNYSWLFYNIMFIHIEIGGSNSNLNVNENGNRYINWVPEKGGNIHKNIKDNVNPRWRQLHWRMTYVNVTDVDSTFLKVMYPVVDSAFLRWGNRELSVDEIFFKRGIMTVWLFTFFS